MWSCRFLCDVGAVPFQYDDRQVVVGRPVVHVRIDRQDDLVVYRQELNAAAGKPVGDVGWKGGELIAVRVHLPSRIRYHNAGAGNLKRGNILVWEQPLADRQAGTPLEIEARIEETSILSSTLALFAVSGLLALLVLATIIWWVVRKGRRGA